MIARQQYLDAVASCIGTPVGHRGRTIGGALDCVGVPWAAATACGLVLPATQVYGSHPTGDELASGLAGYADRCERMEDAHMMQVMIGRHARHVVVPVQLDADGLVWVVHAWAKAKVVERTRLAYEPAAFWRIRRVA